MNGLLGGGYSEDFLKAIGIDKSKMEEEQRTQGLLSAGLALLAGSGPSSQPRGLGQLVGQAGMQGIQAMRGAGEDQITNAIRSLQVKDMMDKRQREAKFRQAVSGAYTMKPTVQGMLDTQSNIDPAMLEQTSIESLAAQTPATQKTFDQSKYIDAVREYDPMEYARLMFKENKVPEAIQTLEILATRPDLLKTKLAVSSAGANQINLPTKTQAELMSEVYAPQVKIAFDEARQARTFATQSKVVSDLLKGKGGGELVKKGSELAKMFGIENETTTLNDLANSLAVRGATTMRAPGSGSTSDLEFNAYKQAFPSLANTDAGRQIMAKYADKFAKRAELIADYKAELLAKGKYSMTAVSEYDKSLGPVLDDDFNNFVKSFGGSGQSQAGGNLDFRKNR